MLHQYFSWHKEEWHCTTWTLSSTLDFCHLRISEPTVLPKQTVKVIISFRTNDLMYPQSWVLWKVWMIPEGESSPRTPAVGFLIFQCLRACPCFPSLPTHSLHRAPSDLAFLTHTSELSAATHLPACLTPPLPSSNNIWHSSSACNF